LWSVTIAEKFSSLIHGCWERNANQSLSVTPMDLYRLTSKMTSWPKPSLQKAGVKAFIYCFLELFTFKEVKRLL